MKRNRQLVQGEVDMLHHRFVTTLTTATAIFGERLFRLPPSQGKTKGALSRPLYDAEMIAIDNLIDRKDDMIARAAQISEAIAVLAMPESESYDLIVARANTSTALLERIDKIQEAIAASI